ncbi:Triose-phosphate transporter domain isoform B [Micractinium conductrix]|nr:Triose-phosphate transporter domain isoform B [Micractinium conductrix]|eukprot:PSC69942.1 Triose-phosphate transporter domain isoform B [Micractinium conductrix]
MFGMSKLVIAVVASVAWMSVSSGLILLNKELLSHGFHFPMALSGLGMAFSGTASYLCCRVFKIVEAKKNLSPRFYVTKILPVGLFMALTLHFGNLVYLYLTVAFIQMLKAFTPIIAMIALFVAGLETPTRRLVASVSFIAVGTALASAGEVNLSLPGMLIMFLSELFESIRLVMTQLLLTGLRFHPIEGLMYLAPACTFWLALGSLLLELRPMLAAGAFGLMAQRPGAFLAAAAMGFAVNSLAYIVIQAASSLTLKVLGTVKNALVVCLGVAMLGERVTGLQGLGYAVSVAAFFWYQKIKMQQIKQDSHGGHLLAAAVGKGGDGKNGSPGLPRYAVPAVELAADAVGSRVPDKV